MVVHTKLISVHYTNELLQSGLRVHAHLYTSNLVIIA